MSGQALTREQRHGKVAAVRDKMLARTEDFERALSDIIPADSFVQTALTALTENPDLLSCSAESILLASLKAAQAGLRLDGRQAALVPFKGQATFMPMVEGVLDLISRNPGVAKVEARAVRDGDEFRYHYGTDPDLTHIPATEPTAEREVTHAYAIVWWTSGAPPTFEVMDRSEIEAARNASRAPNSPAWRNWYGEMARKTAIHRIKKYVDLAPDTANRLSHIMDAEWAAMNGKREAKAESGVADLNARIAAKRDGEEGPGDASEEGPAADEAIAEADLEARTEQLANLIGKAKNAKGVTKPDYEEYELVLADAVDGQLSASEVGEAIQGLSLLLVDADVLDEQPAMV